MQNKHLLYLIINFPSNLSYDKFSIKNNSLVESTFSFKKNKSTSSYYLIIKIYDSLANLALQY